MPPPLSPAETQRILETLGHHPNKKLGQNFLVDGNIVRKSLSLAEVKAGDNVVEVGPGLGTLTRALLAAEAHVFAIEFDKRLFDYLSESLVAENKETFVLQNADAVDYPLGLFAESEQSTEAFKIVANLPYSIATPWLDKVLSGPLPEKMVLMLQKEAADRFMATPGNKSYGAISIFLEAAYNQKAGHKVASQCFHPIPNVDSVLLHLEKKKEPFIFSQPTKQLIRQMFTQRRKQIGGLVKKFGSETSNTSQWLEMLQTEGLATARPEVLPLEIWKQLEK